MEKHNFVFKIPKGIFVYIIILALKKQSIISISDTKKIYKSTIMQSPMTFSFGILIISMNQNQ